VNTFAIGYARYFDLLDLAPDIERAAAALSGRLQFLLNDGGWCIHQVLHKINETTHVASAVALFNYTHRWPEQVVQKSWQKS